MPVVTQKQIQAVELLNRGYTASQAAAAMGLKHRQSLQQLHRRAQASFNAVRKLCESLPRR
jgi:hypothetical protein